MRCYPELFCLTRQIRRRADLRCHHPAYQEECHWNLPVHCRRPVFPVEYHSNRMERSGLQTDRKKRQPVPGKRQMLLNYHPWMQQLLLLKIRLPVCAVIKQSVSCVEIQKWKDTLLLCSKPFLTPVLSEPPKAGNLAPLR